MNVLFILTDQLKASSLPLYSENQIKTPNIDRLAMEGVTFTNNISSHPVCGPYRGMLLTGRNPQTTGHIINWVRTRHDEIGIGDVFSHAGYKTAWIGKWHLHTGAFPGSKLGPDFVPEGRDRLGFEYWRAYNLHMKFFDGFIHTNDWRFEQWQGYETDALNRYAIEFLDRVGDDPFCLFLSPHQPHPTPEERKAPEKYYEMLPEDIKLPANVPKQHEAHAVEMYRHYLAMILALDDMLGELLDYLDRTGKAENTLVVFTSDHGTQAGAHADEMPGPDWHRPWDKRMPYEECIHVPLIMRLPGVLDGGVQRDTLIAPIDFLPSLCGLFGIPIPRTVEGYDLSGAWQAIPEAFERDAVLTMNFSASYNYLDTGMEWRGVRTRQHSYVRWLNGRTQMYDLQVDPLQMDNLSGKDGVHDLEKTMEIILKNLMDDCGDELKLCSDYNDWFDNYRRVVRNAFGNLSHPEDQPDWSLLR